jgi:hypothetical protein
MTTVTDVACSSESAMRSIIGTLNSFKESEAAWWSGRGAPSSGAQRIVKEYGEINSQNWEALQPGMTVRLSASIACWNTSNAKAVSRSVAAEAECGEITFWTNQNEEAHTLNPEALLNDNPEAHGLLRHEMRRWDCWRPGRLRPPGLIAITRHQAIDAHRAYCTTNVPRWITGQT